MRRTTAIPLLLCAALASGACGGDGPAASGGEDRAGRNRDAALDYARCMRENGVDMPDPRRSEDGGIVIGGGGTSERVAPPPAETLRQAQEACKEHLDEMRPPEMSEGRQQEFKERALAHARCMREQGLDFPDPQFGEDGTVTMHAGEPGDGLDPRSPRFKKAMEVCREKSGGGGPIVEAAPAGGGS